MPGSDSIESRMIIDCTMCFDSEEEYAPGCEVCDFDGKLFMNLDDLDITI
jgi:hypothetical protein